MIEVKRFKKFNSELENIWKSLEENSKISFFQTYQWNKLWVKRILNNKIDLSILVIIYENKVTDILPLYLEKKHFLSKLVFLGGLNTDYKNIISTNKSYFKIKNFTQNDFIKFLTKHVPRFDYILFENMLSNNKDNLNVLSIFLNLNKKNINLRVNTKKFTYENYINRQINKKFLNDIYRQIRRLKKLGKLKFLVISNQSEKKEYTDLMIKLKSIQYKKSGGGLFKIRGYEKMYRDILDNKELLNCLHLSALLVGNNVIAVHYGFLFKNILYYVMPVYNRNWFQYSPGNVLLHYLIKESFNQNFDYLDFTEGNNNYKKIWANQSYNIYEFFYPKSIISKFYLFFFKLIKNLYGK